MKLGIHAPKQGATDVFKQVAAAGLGEMIVWTISERPEDAEALPDAFHIFRVPTPWPGEDEQEWLNRIDALVAPWWQAFAGHGGFVWQIGNEPEVNAGPDSDVPNPWAISDWKAEHETYAVAFSQQYPRNGMLSAPFNAGNADALDAAYVAPYQGIAVHSYWWANKDEMMDQHAGLSYAYASQLGKPVYVTECNSRPTNPEQLAQWAKNASLMPAVAGVAFYIADCPVGDRDAPFNITPFDAQIVSERFKELTRQSPAPSPPNNAPTGFGAAESPLLEPSAAKDAWVNAIAAHGVADAQEIVDAYWRYAPVIGYSPDLALAQACLESTWFTHVRWTEKHNPAGIGITGDNVSGYDFKSVARGVQSHLALLNCYFGDGSDPWGALNGTGFGHFTEGFTRLEQLNGVWAVPGTTYAQTIAEIANEVTGGAAPAPGGTPMPTQRYEIVRPVDCPVVQGSDGAYSHGGNVPGFYAIDYGCQEGTPVLASADGAVLYAYWSDANPISARTGHSLYIEHDNGYSTFSCHLSVWNVQQGDHVKQGDVIGLSGSPGNGNGYGEGAHLHWEVWRGAWPNGVRVKMEDLEAQGIAGPWSGAAAPEVDMRVDGHPDDGKLARQWHGPNWSSTTWKPKAGAIPLNPTSGAYTTWKAEFLAGRPLGFALSKEEYDPASNGTRFLQYFSNGSIEGTRAADGTWSFAVNS